MPLAHTGSRVAMLGRNVLAGVWQSSLLWFLFWGPLLFGLYLAAGFVYNVAVLKVPVQPFFNSRCASPPQAILLGASRQADILTMDCFSLSVRPPNNSSALLKSILPVSYQNFLGPTIHSPNFCIHALI